MPNRLRADIIGVAAVICVLAAAPCCLRAQQKPQPDRRPAGDELRNKVDTLVDSILETEAELSVPLRQSKIIRMKEDVFRIAIADPAIIETVAFGSRELEIIGKETGSTTMTLWVGSKQQAQTLSILVRVTRDTEVDERRRLEYGELQRMINEMFPGSKIQLIPIADKLIVRGQARDEEEATRIMALVQENLAQQRQQQQPGGGVLQGAAAQPFPDASTLPSARVINMLSVPGVKQVMLKVRIAELSRSAVRRLGADFDIEIDSADEFLLSSVLAGGGNIVSTATFDEETFRLALNAISSTGMGKILAEPNLVVLSGQSANFVAGGQFAVPTVVGVGGAEAATTRFQAFGTQVSFTPTVIDRDRIRLNVTPTFSTINRENTVQGIFGLDTRAVQTTVELREGQVLAIAGLLQEQQSAEESRIPFLGDIRLFKPLAQNKSISRSEKELIILVSPELVHPMEPEAAPTILPGMEVTEPDDVDFFLYGNIEGRPGVHHRSTVWEKYKNRLCNCKEKHYEIYHPSEDYYLHGSHGFSE